MIRRSRVCVVLAVAAASCRFEIGSATDGGGEGEGEAVVVTEGEGEGEGVPPAEGEGEGGAPFVGPRVVAVGYGGRRLTSDDGTNWRHDVQDVADGGDDDRLLRGVCAFDRVVLAVGGSVQGRVLRSVDGGASWSSFTDDLGWIGACAAGSVGGRTVVVTVGSSRSNRSLDGGLSWVDARTHFSAAGQWQMRDVMFVDGRFLAVGDTGVSTSSDGINWSAPAGPRGLFRVAHGNGVFVAVGRTKRARSVDGVTWTEQARATPNDVVFAQGRFLVVGEGFLETSTDGSAWSTTTGTAPDRVVFGVVDGAPVYVGADYPDRRLRSSDGTTWTQTARDDGNAIEDLVFVP